MDAIQEKELKGKEQNRRLRDNLSRVRKKLIVISGKGGVGKTTVAVNIAYGLAVQGQRVGILDVDIHGPNIAKMLGIEDRILGVDDSFIKPIEITPNLKAVSLALMIKDRDMPIIWRGPLKMMTIKQLLADVDWGELDYLVVDCPPGTGDEPLSVCQLIPDMDGAVIVTTPQDVAILDSRKSVIFAKQLKIPIVGIIENMSGFECPHCGKSVDLFGRGGGEEAANDLGVPFLGRIAIEQDIVRSGDSGRPFIQFNRGTAAALNMNKMISRVTDHMDHNRKVI